VPVFSCEYGTLANRYGIRINEFLTQHAPDPGQPAVTHPAENTR